MNPTLKTFLWLAVLAVIAVAVGQTVGGRHGALFALIFVCVGNLFAYFYSDKLVLRMYGAKEVSPEEAPRLHRILEELADNGGIPKPRLYFIPSEAPNAFATGRGPGHAAVAVTAGITRLLDERELRGVLAHELGHVINRDVLLMTVVATVAGVIGALGDMAKWSLFFGLGGHDGDDERPHPLIYVFLLMILGLAASLVHLAISRAREFAADETGARISGTPLTLASALAKTEAYARQIPLEANPATAHLFIVQPLLSGGLTSLFTTHPPIPERIARLEQLAERMGVAA